MTRAAASISMCATSKVLVVPPPPLPPSPPTNPPINLPTPPHEQIVEYYHDPSVNRKEPSCNPEIGLSDINQCSANKRYFAHPDPCLCCYLLLLFAMRVIIGSISFLFLPYLYGVCGEEKKKTSSRPDLQVLFSGYVMLWLVFRSTITCGD